MTEKAISPNSLANLKQSNRESNQLTREAIETALLRLLEEKSLAQITISELVSKAGVSRNAFYRNYRSKEAICEHILLTIVRPIFRRIKSFNLKTQAYQAWLYLFQETKKQAHILKLIFQQQLGNLVTDIVARRLIAYQKFKGKKHSSYITSFWSNAIVSVLSNWVADNMLVPEEEMAAMGLPLLP